MYRSFRMYRILLVHGTSFRVRGIRYPVLRTRFCSTYFTRYRSTARNIGYRIPVGYSTSTILHQKFRTECIYSTRHRIHRKCTRVSNTVPGTDYLPTICLHCTKRSVPFRSVPDKTLPNRSRGWSAIRASAGCTKSAPCSTAAKTRTSTRAITAPTASSGIDGSEYRGRIYKYVYNGRKQELLLRGRGLEIDRCEEK